MNLPGLPSTMHAWVAPRYGGPDVLRLVERPLPTVGPNDVLVRVSATTVSAADRRLRACDFPAGLKLVGRLAVGLRGPRKDVLGTECAGEIVAVGAAVSRWRVGDQVIAYPGIRLGAHAAYLALPQTAAITAWPPGLSRETASAVGFGAMTARDYLRRARTRPGERILVIGAAGAVGSALVQLAADAGAIVTGVTSTPNLDLVRGLGAAEVIDYTRTAPVTLGERFDIVAECVGTVSMRQGWPLLVEGGRFLAIAGGVGDMLTRSARGRRCIAGPASERPDDLVAVVDLAAQSRFRPVIDQVMPFEALPDAHARADSGRKRGSVVVTMPTAG